MTLVDPSGLRDWEDGDIVLAVDYKEDREILYTANNGTHATLANHIASTTAHAAANITYSGLVSAANVKAALDALKVAVDAAGGGGGGPSEIMFATGLNPGGLIDDSTALQTHIDAAVAANKMLWVPAGTYLIAPHAEGVDQVCLHIRTNSTIYFEPGTKFVLGAEQPDWTRMMHIDNAQNVKLLGAFELDGNWAATALGNEHMAGLFIFNSQHVYIENVYSHHHWGDNIFVGGTLIDPSVDVFIHTCRTLTAGRKNFVIHYVDQLHVVNAIMDNRNGGAPHQGAGYTLGGGIASLDVEPDAFDGSRPFYQRMDYVSITGEGIDMTVGTGFTAASQWVLDIGTLDMRIYQAKAQFAAIISYGITFRCDNCYIRNMNPIASNKAIDILYSCVWDVKNMYVENYRDWVMTMGAVSTDVPHINIDRFKIDGRAQAGSRAIQNWGGNLSIGFLQVQNVAGVTYESLATTEVSTNFVDNVWITNSGSSTSAAFFLSSFGTGVRSDLRIGAITVRDTRGASKVGRIFEYETQAAMDGVMVGNVINPNSVIEQVTSFGNFPIANKLVGGTLTPAIYYIEGDPEGLIAAPQGSIAMRKDGGSQTTLYVKEVGSGNTGWVSPGGSSGLSGAGSPEDVITSEVGELYRNTASETIGDNLWVHAAFGGNSFGWYQMFPHLSGEGSPEGVVEAPMGMLYSDLTATEESYYQNRVWMKAANGGSNSGWVPLNPLYTGDGSPENVIAAPMGSIYTDIDDDEATYHRTKVYIKSFNGGANTGWVPFNPIYQDEQLNPNGWYPAAAGSIYTSYNGGSMWYKGTAGYDSLGWHRVLSAQSGSGSPEGVNVGSPGDMYLNIDGGTGATFWVKETGFGTNLGWVAK